MELKDILEMLIQAVIIPVVPIIATYVMQYLKQLADETSKRIENETVRHYMQEASDAVIQAVEYTTQTYVDALKKEGSFDKTAQQQAFSQAKEVALQLMTQETKELLTEVYGDLSMWLDTRIEQTVGATKASYGLEMVEVQGIQGAE